MIRARVAEGLPVLSSQLLNRNSVGRLRDLPERSESAHSTTRRFSLCPAVVRSLADQTRTNMPITLSTYAHLMPAEEEVARTVLDSALGVAGPADAMAGRIGSRVASVEWRN